MDRRKPDTEAQRQAALVASASAESDDQEFVEAISDDWDDEAVAEPT